MTVLIADNTRMKRKRRRTVETDCGLFDLGHDMLASVALFLTGADGLAWFDTCRAFRSLVLQQSSEPTAAQGLPLRMEMLWRQWLFQSRTVLWTNDLLLSAPDDTRQVMLPLTWELPPLHMCPSVLRTLFGKGCQLCRAPRSGTVMLAFKRRLCRRCLSKCACLDTKLQKFGVPTEVLALAAVWCGAGGKKYYWKNQINDLLRQRRLPDLANRAFAFSKYRHAIWNVNTKGYTGTVGSSPLATDLLSKAKLFIARIEAEWNH